MAYSLMLGEKLITDILNPRADEIDLTALEDRLRTTYRFSGCRDALTVHTHRALARLLAERAGAPFWVLEWCWHHDDHEAIIGDIPGPLKSLIGAHTPILDLVEQELDLAICKARGIQPPNHATRDRVHVFDKMAETIEWTIVLGKPMEAWNAPVPFPHKVVTNLLEQAMAVV